MVHWIPWSPRSTRSLMSCGDDGTPIAESRGVDHQLADRWRAELKRMDEEIFVWARTYRRAYSTVTNQNGATEQDDTPSDPDPYEDLDDDAVAL